MSYVLGYILLISTRNWKIQTNCCPRADDLENFTIEKLQFLKYKNKYLLFLRNPLQAPLPKESWSSQGDTWCPKGFWDPAESQRLKGVLGCPRGFQMVLGVLGVLGFRDRSPLFQHAIYELLFRLLFKHFFGDYLTS